MKNKPQAGKIRQARRDMPLLIIILFGLDSLICLAYGLNYYAGQPFYPLNIFLDLDGEANLPSWYSSLQLSGIALFFGLFAYSRLLASAAGNWLLLALPILFLGLSLDEIAQIHEWFGMKSDALLAGGTRENTFFKNTGIWMFLLGSPLLVFLGSLAWSLRVQFSFSPRMLPLFTAGILIFMLGTVGIETITNIPAEGSPAYVALVFAEELLEMFGATFILWSALELLRKIFFQPEAEDGRRKI